jgi:DNA-binding response OmpR family regulator
MELNPSSLMLNTEQGSQKLFKKSAQLLELLIQRGKMATPKELIIDKLWEFEEDMVGSHVDYHISMLRKALKAVKANVIVKNMRNVGYILIEG